MIAGGQVKAAFRICYFNGIIPLWRSPLLIWAVFLTPLSFLFFLFVITGPTDPQFLPHAVVGGVLFTVIFTGNGMLNDCAYLRLERQLQQIFVASPVRPFAYLMGMALSELAFTIPALVLFLAILLLVTPVSLLGFVGLLGVVLLTWLMATSLGFLISTLFKQLREIWPIGTLTFSSLAVLPPIFYPAYLIPARFQWVAFLAPSTYASQLADAVTGVNVGSPLSPGVLNSPWLDLAGLAGATILFALAAAYLARWREP
ncbi:MAG: ABC transporter permease [Thermoplasmata archaeon]|nr:ABC transporter permease [Thermoplasmata archaeon]